MKQIAKIVQEIGNGGHIYLPREIVGQKVIITLAEKTIKDIEGEIIQIVRPYLKHIRGIYLHGSYARNEQTPESDIDILVITDGKVEVKKRVNEYEILAISLEQLEKTLEHTAVLILPTLKEAKPILNQGLIEKYKKQGLNKKNTKWYIDTTESSLKLAKDWIKDKDIKAMPHIVYPLVMRLRGLYMIECLITNKDYSNQAIDRYLVRKGLSLNKINQLNRMYRENREKKNISYNKLNYSDILKSYEVIHSYFKKVKSLWERLK